MTTAGLYGKLPQHADFVHRGLPREFVDPVDLWLQTIIVYGRDRHGPAWSERFLSAPVWRFAIAPGLISSLGWTGVLATSIDAVGRLFPLVIAVQVDQSDDAQRFEDGLLARFEDIAMVLIDQRGDVDQAMTLITASGKAGPSFMAPPNSSLAGAIETWSCDDPPTNTLFGIRFWHVPTRSQAAELATGSELFPPDRALALFDRDWQGHGWVRMRDLPS